MEQARWRCAAGRQRLDTPGAGKAQCLASMAGTSYVAACAVFPLCKTPQQWQLHGGCRHVDVLTQDSRPEKVPQRPQLQIGLISRPRSPYNSRAIINEVEVVEALQQHYGPKVCTQTGLL